MELMKLTSADDRVLFQHPDADVVHGCSKRSKIFAIQPLTVEAEEL